VDDLDEQARWDYEQTVAGIRALTEVRFKLLAFLPPISGAALALLTRVDVPDDTKAVLAVLGFAVTLGIVIYDQRNSQLYYALIDRATWLEREQLGLRQWREDLPPGGPYAGRPQGHRLFGLITVSHTRGLALVHGVLLGIWIFALARLKLDAGFAAAIGAAVTLIFLVELERLLKQTNRSRLPLPERPAPAEGEGRGPVL
jgi:hypothetical protein